MIETGTQKKTAGMAKLLMVAQKGMTRAGQGLSEMTGTPVEVIAPSVSAVAINEVTNLVGSPDALNVGLYLSILGDLTGHIVLMFPYPSALSLVDALLELPTGTTVCLDEIGESALCEVGNLTGSFFLNALSDSTNFRLHPSPPAIATDMTEAILDTVLADLGQYGEEMVVIDTNFKQSEKAIQGFFLVFPDRDSLRRLVAWLEQ